MTKKINSSTKRFIKTLKSFSLVELIIVIAIIAILSVAGFVTLTKWIGKTRDTRRLSALETMRRSLEYTLVEDGVLPKPSGEVATGKIKNIEFAYVGDYGESVTKVLGSISTVPEDPSTKGYYKYGVNENLKKFQVAVVLENGDTKVGYIGDKVFAGGEVTKVKGNYTEEDMYIYYDGTIYLRPGLIFTDTGDVELTGAYYVLDDSQNLAYKLSDSDSQDNESAIISAKRALDRQEVDALAVDYSGKDLSSSGNFVNTFSGMVGSPSDYGLIYEKISSNDPDVQLADENEIEKKASEELTFTDFSQATEYKMCDQTLHGDTQSFYTQKTADGFNNLCSDYEVSFECDNGDRMSGNTVVNDEIGTTYYRGCNIDTSSCMAGGTVPCIVN